MGEFVIYAIWFFRLLLFAFLAVGFVKVFYAVHLRILWCYEDAYEFVWGIFVFCLWLLSIALVYDVTEIVING